MSDIQKQDTELVKKHVQQLMEHFDSVQIFVTRSEPSLDGTAHCSQGGGNWFARYGQVHSWLTKENEGNRIQVREEP